MKLSQEEKAAISLNKEFLMFKKYANRPGVLPIEADYYNRMAAATSVKIDWDLLKPHKKQKAEEGDEELYYKESRFRNYH